MRERKDITSERGQTMAEFAVVLPILVVLLFGIMQFTDAARAGARKAAVSRQSGDPAGDCRKAVLAAAADLDQAVLAPTVQCKSAWTPGSDVEVDASYPYNITLFGLPVFSGDLKTVMKERVE